MLVTALARQIHRLVSRGLQLSWVQIWTWWRSYTVQRVAFRPHPLTSKDLAPVSGPAAKVGKAQAWCQWAQSVQTSMKVRTWYKSLSSENLKLKLVWIAVSCPARILKTNPPWVIICFLARPIKLFKTLRRRVHPRVAPWTPPSHDPFRSAVLVQLPTKILPLFFSLRQQIRIRISNSLIVALVKIVQIQHNSKFNPPDWQTQRNLNQYLNRTRLDQLWNQISWWRAWSNEIIHTRASRPPLTLKTIRASLITKIEGKKLS